VQRLFYFGLFSSRNVISEESTQEKEQATDEETTNLVRLEIDKRLERIAAYAKEHGMAGLSGVSLRNERSIRGLSELELMRLERMCLNIAHPGSTIIMLMWLRGWWGGFEK